MRVRGFISSEKDIFLRRTTQTWLLHRKVLEGQEVPGWERWAKIAIVRSSFNTKYYLPKFGLSRKGVTRFLVAFEVALKGIHLLN